MEGTVLLILLKRIYDPAGPEGGHQYLVDRLWPRGVKKDSLQIEAWLKEVAPSTELRLWYQHDPGKWPEFKRRYFAELELRPEFWRPLLNAARKGTITLLYGSRETKINNAAALKEFLEKKMGSKQPKLPNP